MTDSTGAEQPTPPTSPSTPSAPPPSPYAAQPGPAKPPTILSLLSMIGGIVGLLLACCFGAGFIFSLAGIILGHLGLGKENARGMAMTGLITGYIGAGLAILMWILLLVSPALLSFIPWTSYSGGFSYP